MFCLNTFLIDIHALLMGYLWDTRHHVFPNLYDFRVSVKRRYFEKC